MLREREIYTWRQRCRRIGLLGFLRLNWNSSQISPFCCREQLFLFSKRKLANAQPAFPFRHQPQLCTLLPWGRCWDTVHFPVPPWAQPSCSESPQSGSSAGLPVRGLGQVRPIRSLCQLEINWRDCYHFLVFTTIFFVLFFYVFTTWKY